MRKHIILVLAGILSFVLAACGGQAQQVPTTAPAQPATTAPERPTVTAVPLRMPTIIAPPCCCGATTAPEQPTTLIASSCSYR
jgi:general L-amino acid transport system substrate-binding protein